MIYSSSFLTPVVITDYAQVTTGIQDHPNSVIVVYAWEESPDLVAGVVPVLNSTNFVLENEITPLLISIEPTVPFSAYSLVDRKTLPNGQMWFFLANPAVAVLDDNIGWIAPRELEPTVVSIPWKIPVPQDDDAWNDTDRFVDPRDAPGEYFRMGAFDAQHGVKVAKIVDSLYQKNYTEGFVFGTQLDSVISRESM